MPCSNSLLSPREAAAAAVATFSLLLACYYDYYYPASSFIYYVISLDFSNSLHFFLDFNPLCEMINWISDPGVIYSWVGMGEAVK